ncbi:MAG: N-acetyl-gamma-glutamyl-phosphate reductase [Lachnospiraceae bacterium]|nr:N-acetyl-gamma-glutamyl-phosphate reductase [Lachnospiraceae bacterium]
MKTKIYIDGSEGTTGLRINERLEGRDDIELLRIRPELRKDAAERQRMINASDITFLCLPDAAAREAVSLATGERVRIIDASTAHRTEPGWAYGFPELSAEFRERITQGKRVAVPGCHASGFMALVYPLVKEGLLPADYPVVSYSLTGYSGGGKKMIAAYEAEERPRELSSPRAYALTQQHKHLKEMKAIAGLAQEPLFTPIVADYYSGMAVFLPLAARLLSKEVTPDGLRSFYREYYAGQRFLHVLTEAETDALGGFLAGNARSGWDGMEIVVSGSGDRLFAASRFDNLGKGASGAAIQCMNLMLGCPEEKGLVLHSA